MKHFVYILGLVLAATACNSVDNYVFRNDVRPEFEKSITVAELSSISDDENTTVIDVRLMEDFEAEPVLIPGANYMNPEEIEQWYSEIPKDTKVIVYCVKGHWVSQKAATFLDDKGYDVIFLEGGIHGWQEENK